MSVTEPLGLAREFLLSMRHGRDVSELATALVRVDPGALERALADDAARMAFWIDIYHGAVLRHDIRADAGSIDRLRHFRRPVVAVASRQLSLDAIEHGLLRRSRWKLGLGYVPNPLPSGFERRNRVGQIDARVHFALNCGVASCPPISTYDAERIDEQLEQATHHYLQAETEPAERGLVVPALLLWYIGDFGGPAGVRRLLRRHGIEGWNGPIRFKRYDWTPAPGRWLDREN